MLYFGKMSIGGKNVLHFMRKIQLKIHQKILCKTLFVNFELADLNHFFFVITITNGVNTACDLRLRPGRLLASLQALTICIKSRIS